MSEGVLEIRQRLVETLSYHGIGTHAEVPLGTLADFGLMNGAMIVRASGVYLEAVNDTKPVEPSVELHDSLVRASLAATSHIASLSDVGGNKKMAEIFGAQFLACFQFIKKIERMRSNPYEDVFDFRAITDEDQAIADTLDAEMAQQGAEYLKSPNGQLLLSTEPEDVQGQGCPLRRRNSTQSTELENLVSSLVNEYFDSDSPFYGTGFHGIGNFALLRLRASGLWNPSEDTRQYDWQLPTPSEQH
jgi:hypothetical protein